MPSAFTIENQLDSEFPLLFKAQSAFRSSYDVNEEAIGRGRYAIVKLCTNRQTKQQFAGKFIKKWKQKEILKELRVLQLSKLSPHIVTLFEVHESECNIVFLLEHASGGDIQTLLDKEIRFTELDCKKIILGTLHALKFLHDLEIIHLDIKPQNILLSKPWPDITIRLCDFGLSRFLNDNMPQQIAGTTDYMGKITCLLCISSQHSTRSYWIRHFDDGMRSLGDDNLEVFVNITKCEYDFPDFCFSNVSSHAKDFIQSLLQRIPKKRPSVSDAIDDAWFENVTSSIE